MEIFAKLDIHLQSKIMVEYLGNFRMVDGIPRPTYILPQVLDRFNAKYASIPKPQLEYQEWGSNDNEDEYTFVLFVRREYSVFLHVPSLDTMRTMVGYRLTHVDEREFIENPHTHIIVHKHNEPDYINVGGYCQFWLEFDDEQDTNDLTNNSPQNLLYNLLWNIWENAEDEFGEADEDYEQYIQEVEYDNYQHNNY